MELLSHFSIFCLGLTTLCFFVTAPWLTVLSCRPGLCLSEKLLWPRSPENPGPVPTVENSSGFLGVESGLGI